MKETQVSGFQRAADDFMIKRKWYAFTCEKCQTTFYEKHLSSGSKNSCGWHGCATDDPDFRKLSKRSHPVTVTQVADLMSDFFRSRGLTLVPPRNIVNEESETDLIIAGVQMFDGVIRHNQPMLLDKMYVAQPCTRMQFQDVVGLQDGISTSFVNVCTEKINPTLDEHLELVDLWFSMLSKLGMHMKDFTVVRRTETHDWDTGPFLSLELFFLYGGLELGDASYAEIPRLSGNPVPISDIGFGLERIVWALNKTESYFDLLAPWTVRGTREMCDFCRTVALLALCGVKAGNKGAGLQFKRLCKTLSEKYYRSDLYEAVSYYYDYWQHLIEPIVSRDLVLKRVRLEVDRLVNVKISQLLKLPPPREETTDEYFDRLVYANNVSIKDLREALHLCQT